MMTTVTTNKPFHIEKKRVYEAYKAVRSNRGAAGVDGQTWVRGLWAHERGPALVTH